MERSIKVISVLFVTVLLILAVWYTFFRTEKNETVKGPAINNFDDCAAAGYQIFESYPRICMTPDKKTYTEDIGNEFDKRDVIIIDSPRPNDVVKSPLKITGKARGFWFNEASFPVKLYDASGKQLGNGIANVTSGDWMTQEFVPFEATLQFQSPSSGKGMLVLERDNPSGLDENNDNLNIPVNFVSGGATQLVSLYYYNKSLDKDIDGNILCSAKGLHAVQRTIDKTDSIIGDTIRMLMEGRISGEESVIGVATNFPIDGLELESSTVDERGVLVLGFSDPKGKTVGGACRVNILRAQIEATAKQFPQVKSVKIIPEELFQP